MATSNYYLFDLTEYINGIKSVFMRLVSTQQCYFDDERFPVIALDDRGCRQLVQEIVKEAIYAHVGWRQPEPADQAIGYLVGMDGDTRALNELLNVEPFSNIYYRLGDMISGTIHPRNYHQWVYKFKGNRLLMFPGEDYRILDWHRRNDQCPYLNHSEISDQLQEAVDCVLNGGFIDSRLRQTLYTNGVDVDELLKEQMDMEMNFYG